MFVNCEFIDNNFISILIDFKMAVIEFTVDRIRIYLAIYLFYFIISSTSIKQIYKDRRI